MSKFLPILIIVVAALAGGGGGFFLKTSSASADAAEEHTDNDSHVSEDKQKNKSGGGHGKPSDGISNYLKFKRQFVIPVMKDGKPEMLMVFDINIEVDGSFSDNAYSYEPRLRDAILTQLFIFANDGDLTQITESTETLTNVKAVLLETARRIMGDSAREILLIDIGIQEY